VSIHFKRLVAAGVLLTSINMSAISVFAVPEAIASATASATPTAPVQVTVVPATTQSTVTPASPAQTAAPTQSAPAQVTSVPGKRAQSEQAGATVSPAAPTQSAEPKEKKGGLGDFFHKKHKRAKVDIDKLVKENVISKETGEKVKTYLKEHKSEHKAEFERVKAMSQDERKAYFEQKNAEGKLGVWAEMVAAGILTQDEADAIKAARKKEVEAKESK
jgi:hypothetical protein